MGEPDAGALSGVRVLDVTDERGAFATRLLADLGADVIRVEAPDGGRLRALAPFVAGASVQHLYHDAGKRSVVIDRDTDDGAKRFVALVGTADAIVETERLGHDALLAANPAIVHATITPFGLGDPRTAWKGNDLIATAAGGLAWVCGKPGDPPNQPGADQGAKMTGLATAFGVLAALHGGVAGVHLDISMQVASAMATVQTSNPHNWAWRKTIPKRPGLTAVHQASDGQWVTLMVRPDRLDVFLAWCKEDGVEVPDDKHELDDAFGGTAKLALLIRDLVARYPRDEFYAKAWGLDLLGLPVNTLPDLDRCDHLQETGAFVPVDLGGDAGTLRFPKSPLGEAAVPLRRAPRLGEHTADVFAEGRRPRLAAPSGRDLAHALEGIRVVDFCWVLAGPLGTRLLANFGAEVIRVEAGERSYTEVYPRGVRDPDVGAFHNTVNTHKRSITIDPRTPQGRELLLELIATSDVVTNNYRPGSFEAMGFGYEVLRAHNPGIISIHMPGCGRSGPWRDRGSFGNMIAAASGLSFLTGFPGRSPRGLGVAHPDFTGPYLLAMTAVAAVRRRAQRGGFGEELEVNQLTGTLALIGAEWLEYDATGTPPPMRANRDANWCPHGVYPSQGEDEWVALAVAADDVPAWGALCAVLGRPDLVDDGRFADHASRKANEEELDRIVGAWTRERDKWSAADELQAAGVAAAPVEHLADAMDADPALSRWVERVRHPAHPDVEVPVPGEAIQEAGAYRYLQPAPSIGADNDDVLGGILGCTAEKIEDLRASGVVWTPSRTTKE